MANQSYFNLYIFHPHDKDALAHLGSKPLVDWLVSNQYIGFGEQLTDGHQDAMQALQRSLTCTSRHGSLQASFEELLLVANDFSSLQCLSADAFTHREFLPNGDEDADVEDSENYGTDCRYCWVTPSSYQAIIDDVDRFMHWNVLNPQQLAKVTGYGAQDTLDAIYAPFVLASSNYYAIDDEYNGANTDNVIKTLQVVRAYLLHAQQNNLCAVFTTQFIESIAWYRCMPFSPKIGEPGYDGKFYVNTLYTSPQVSSAPISTLPPKPLINHSAEIAETLAKHDIDKRLAYFFAQPSWVKDDACKQLFQQHKKLITEGRVVWAAAPNLGALYSDPAHRNGMMTELIYDPSGHTCKYELSSLADILKHDKKQPEDAVLQAFDAFAAQNKGRIFNADAPIEGKTLKVSSVYVDTRYFIGGIYNCSLLPVYILDELPGMAVVVPTCFWPEKYLKHVLINEVEEYSQALARQDEAQRLIWLPEIPVWASDPAFIALFSAHQTLLTKGKVVMARLIQVNKCLLEPTKLPQGALGKVLYDARGYTESSLLGALANQLIAMKGKSFESAQLQNFADLISDENKLIFNYEAPFKNRALSVSSIYFDRGYFPEGLLSGHFLPILVADECPGMVMPLPSCCWPKYDIESWENANYYLVKKYQERIDRKNKANHAAQHQQSTQHLSEKTIQEQAKSKNTKPKKLKLFTRLLKWLGF